MASEVKFIYFYYAKTHEKPLYVGQTVDIEQRFKQHLHENPLFQLTDKIYYFDLPETHTKEQVDVIESFFMHYLDPVIGKKRGLYFKAEDGVFKAIYTIVDCVIKAKGFRNFLDECCCVVSVKDGVIEWE